MSNIDEILKLISTDKNIRDDFINIESIPELFKICKSKGYSKTEAEFENFLKKNEILKLSSNELLKISGVTGYNTKRIPALILASFTISGNISASEFAGNPDIFCFETNIRK